MQEMYVAIMYKGRLLTLDYLEADSYEDGFDIVVDTYKAKGTPLGEYVDGVWKDAEGWSFGIVALEGMGNMNCEYERYVEEN